MKYVIDTAHCGDTDLCVDNRAFNKPDTRAKAIPGASVRTYLVAWLAQWVRDYGIDGFRCETVKHVEPATWAALFPA